MNIKIPMTDRAYYAAKDVPAILSQVQKLSSQYAREITQAGTLTNLPEDLIKSFIFIESKGENVKPRTSASPTGLMQIGPGPSTDTIYLENKQKRLTPAEKVILAKHLGSSRLNRILGQKSLGQYGAIVTTADLIKPEVNILLGAMYLGQLVDLHNEAGNLRLDKVVVRYNRGYFTKPVGATVTEVMAYAKSKFGTVAESYIVKLVGRNGLLEILS